MKKVRSTAEMSTTTLKCRSLRHAWDHKMTKVVSESPRRLVVELHLKCARCPGRRIDTIANGRLVKRRYKSPPNYLFKKKAISVADRNAEVRREWIERTLDRREQRKSA